MSATERNESSVITATIPLKQRAAVKRALVINDSLPGIVLLLSGLETLSNKGFTRDFIPYVSIVLGLFVIRWAIEELRHEAKRRKVKWFDIVGGCAILIDAANRYNVHKGFQPAHLMIFIGLVTILRGIFAEKLPGFRRVVLKDDGIFARTSPFHSLSCSWSEVSKIECGPTSIVFILKNERKRLNLKRAENRTEVVDRISETATARGIPVVQAA